MRIRFGSPTADSPSRDPGTGATFRTSNPLVGLAVAPPILYLLYASMVFTLSARKHRWERMNWGLILLCVGILATVSVLQKLRQRD